MPSFTFDHIVHYTEDPHKVIPFIKEKGIHAVVGGEHRRRPTHNVLSYFDLSYIEYIGTSDKEKLQQMNHGPFSMIDTIINSQFTEGFKRFILRTNDIYAAKNHFLNEGLQVHGPVSLSRKKPDGHVLEWQLLFIGDGSQNKLEFPYIIQWGKSDVELKNELINDGVIIERNSQPQFSHIHIAVSDLSAIIKRWSRLLHLEINEPYIDNELQAKCQSLQLDGGNLTFCQPTGMGVVKNILKNSGEKPFQVNLIGEAKEEFILFGGRYSILKN